MDSLQRPEGTVSSHCNCDGLGALVLEQVGCQAAGDGANE